MVNWAKDGPKSLQIEAYTYLLTLETKLCHLNEVIKFWFGGHSLSCIGSGTQNAKNANRLRTPNNAGDTGSGSKRRHNVFSIA